MTHMKNEMVTGPDHHVEGMCEGGVHPCALVPYHFLTAALHTEYKTLAIFPPFAALGFRWQVKLDEIRVGQSL